MFEEYSDILTVEEACEALRVGYNAMYELLNSGKLEYSGFSNQAVRRVVPLIPLSGSTQSGQWFQT